ncbi:TetR/AcrR family transcriptional regulator [Dyadobacter sp. NIV53]|uniref:TetR/AcrR family transcriptional regulator n=1 Tax=Dyadobacter sp. NIV53 TaxID=2861765 RepID=UPI001E353147|nr:TetR/AcrR family transcriptional regulator [Dyadobacter sp. NIV53]
MKERIVKSALNLFWRYGIKSVTMDDIAKELGISKRTIYQHYPDKEAILAMAIKGELSSQKCEIEKLDTFSDNPIEQMIQAADQIRTAIAHMNPTLIYDLKKYYPESWNLFQSYKNEFINKNIQGNLRHGISLGLYRSDIDVEVLSLLRIQEFEIAFDPTIYPADKFHMMHVQMQFIHHFLRGILTEKGFIHYNTIKDNSETEFIHEK